MFNTISGSKLADRSKELFSGLDSLARETELIVRSSAKFSAKGFMLSLFKAVLTGKASFNQIAANLKRTETKSMSRQGVHGRVDQTAVSFMIAATGQALTERWTEQKLICSKIFNRVLVEDSSQAKTHVKNAEDFLRINNYVLPSLGELKRLVISARHQSLEQVIQHINSHLGDGRIDMLEKLLLTGDTGTSGWTVLTRKNILKATSEKVSEVLNRIKEVRHLSLKELDFTKLPPRHVDYLAQQGIRASTKQLRD